LDWYRTKMKNIFIISIKIVLTLTFITGILYPFSVTVISQFIFPSESNGSIIFNDGKIIGSILIGQNFESDKYFWGRPSSINYTPLPSGGSNLAPTSLLLKQQYEERKNKFIMKNRLDTQVIVPQEICFASASGVDPHISIEAARLQVTRISSARSFDLVKTQKIYKLIDSLKTSPKFGFIGKTTINVLQLNLLLDKIK
jgi:potassium-transporting ATPase KdpC subunit